MDIILASKFVIIVTTGMLAYNLYQCMLSFESMREQVDEFLGIMQNETVAYKSFGGLNVMVYLLFPAFYLLLLFLANFSYGVLVCVGIKLFAGSAVSHWMQGEILEREDFSQKFYLINKVDHTINALLMLGILYFVFV